ncbi:hypothetical protein NIES2104_64170 [Leptolyngbya sp. NIES-2104]|nr:hypothetical protein NIES2104_64170 [Leptolyngbya sp. NIES-2104]
MPSLNGYSEIRAIISTISPSLLQVSRCLWRSAHCLLLLYP